MENERDGQSVASCGSSSPQYVRVSSQTRRINISRPVYDQASFDRQFGGGRQDVGDVDVPSSTSLRQRVRSHLPSTPGDLCRRVVRYFPVVEHLRNYRWKSWLLRDLLAGISSGVMHVPQGMGFALLARLPPVYGLYSSIFPGLVYYVFGTSRHLSMGTMALTAMMVGAVVARLVPDMTSGDGQQNTESMKVTLSTSTTLQSTSRDLTSSYVDVTSSESSSVSDAAMKVEVAVSVTLVAGLFQLAMRICQLGGVLCTYMSMPFIVAFLTAAATQIIVTQIPFELGLAIERPVGYFVVPLTVVEVFRHITETNVCALIVSVISIAFLVIIKEYINERFKETLKLPIPAELLLVIFATVVSHFSRLHDRYALPVVGEIPLGLPQPRVPPMAAATSYVVDALVIGVVGFVVAVTMARLMAERNFYEVDSAQELLACGLCNVTGAFFGCFVATQAPPRTLVNESAGGRSQLAGAVSTLVPLLVVLALCTLFEALPVSVLGCVTTCALLPLMKQFAQLRSLWRISGFDFTVWIVTYACTAFVSIAVGLAVGVAVSCLLVIVQSQRVRARRLTRAANTEIYYHCSRPPTSLATTTTYSADTVTMPVGAVVYRVGGPLFFANVDNFVGKLYSDVWRPSDVKCQPVGVSVVASDDRLQESNGDLPKSTTSDDNSVQMDVFSFPKPKSDDAECRDVCEDVRTTGAGTKPSEEAAGVTVADVNYSAEDDDGGGAQVDNGSAVRAVVLDCSRVTFVDSMAVAALKKVHEAYRAAGIQLVFSACDANVAAVMTAAQLLGDSERRIEMYPTVHDAVVAVR